MTRRANHCTPGYRRHRADMEICNQAGLDDAPVGLLARHPDGPIVHVARREDGTRYVYVNGARQLHWDQADFPLVVVLHPACGRVSDPRSAVELVQVLLAESEPARPQPSGVVRALAAAVTTGWPAASSPAATD